MFNSTEYLKMLGREVTAEEAADIVENNKGIITHPGYTHFFGHYLSDGPIPSAIRSGNTKNMLPFFKNREGYLYQITLRDLVILKGFYPEPFSLLKLMECQYAWRDYSIDVNELIKHCIESQYSKEGLMGPKRSEIWFDYFFGGVPAMHVAPTCFHSTEEIKPILKPRPPKAPHRT